MMIMFVLCLQLPPRKVPRTIENTREADETVCKPDDEEVYFLMYLYWSFVLGYGFDM